MTSFITNLIGYSAAVCGTFVMLPQLVKSIKTKKVGDVSAVMLILCILNCSLWTAYGILIKNAPMVLSNVAVFFIGFTEFILKLAYK